MSANYDEDGNIIGYTYTLCESFVEIRKMGSITGSVSEKLTAIKTSDDTHRCPLIYIQFSILFIIIYIILNSLLTHLMVEFRGGKKGLHTPNP